MYSPKPIIYIISLLFAVLPAKAYHYCVTNNDGLQIYYNRTGDNTVEVTYKERFNPTDSYVGTVSIPDAIVTENGLLEVTGIGERAFFNCRQLMDVQLPSHLKYIAHHGFAWCDALTAIVIPAEVTDIQANAFDGCYNLTDIAVNHGNQKYTDLRGVVYSDGKRMLSLYTPGTEGGYTVADGTETIADYAFAAAAFLSGVTLPSSLKGIGANAFYFCSNLTEIDIPASVTYIGAGALSDCISLTEINVAPDNSAFASVNGVLYDKAIECLIQSPGSNVASACVPEGVKEIAPQAFLRNHTLTTLKLPSTLTKIGAAAFVDCPRLTTIEMPASIAEISDMAFGMSPRLEAIYMRSADPKAIKLGSDIFVESTDSNTVLYVPASAVDKYRAESVWSNFHDIRAIDDLKEQTIRWMQADDSLTIGRSTPLNAVASSALPVRYLLTPDSQKYAFIADDDIIVFEPGDITVIAYQSGDSEYLPAEAVAHNFAVSTGITDVEAECHIKVYGGIGQIHIQGAAPDAVADVYDITGRHIYTGLGRDIPVPKPDIYIVRIQGRGFKVSCSM